MSFWILAGCHTQQLLVAFENFVPLTKTEIKIMRLTLDGEASFAA
jgi:hypothetical protein